jgi:Fe-S cluster assembly ATP-binding protein
MLRLENVAWSTPDGDPIVRGVDLTIGEGKLVVITGPNGSGKTSLAKLVDGIMEPTSGKIYFEDEDITNANITERTKKGIAYAFQQPVKFKGMTVKDMLELAAGEDMPFVNVCGLLGKVGLCAEEYIDRELSGSLSGGESKRIEIATVLARNAKLSIFDEPEAGIDLWSFNSLIKVFENMHQTIKGNILIISHQERILNFADQIVLLSEGEIKKIGTKEEIMPLIMGENQVCGQIKV